jgi:Peptidase S46
MSSSCTGAESTICIDIADVRIVFAPEYSAGQFGGDPDNFSFPRFGFDVALYRIYEGGHPIDSHSNYFRWSNSGGVDGELTFVSGHPGRTSRLLTIDQLQFERDTRLPFYLGYYAEERGLLTEFRKKGKEESLIAGPDLFYAENALKLIKGIR